MKVLHDLFPARVRVVPPSTPVDPERVSVTARYEGSRLVSAVRVVLSDDTIMIGADSSDGPMLIFREAYDTTSLHLNKTGTTPTFLVTTSGKTVIYDKDMDCGCGSRLRSWNPYRSLYASGDPSA